MVKVYISVYTKLTEYTPAMGDTERMGIKEVRAALGQRIDAAFYLGEITLLTKNNQDRAAIVPLAMIEKASQVDAYVEKYGPLPTEL